MKGLLNSMQARKCSSCAEVDEAIIAAIKNTYTNIISKNLGVIIDVLKINKKMYTEQIIAINKELKWMDPSHRGFLTLECDKDKILAIFHFINEIKKIDAGIASTATFSIQKDSLKINQLFA